MNKFTKEEIDYLKNNYLTMTRPNMAKHLNRRVEVIQNKLRQLGLKKPPLEDLSKKKYNKLKVIKRVEYNKRKKSRKWLCVCECGKETIKTTHDLITKGVVSCGCYRTDKIKTGYGYISGTYFQTLKNGAEKRNLIFDITIQQINDLIINQNFKCALTGLEIYTGKGSSKKNRAFTASLDRKDSSKGYTLDNVQWIHKDINKMKWDYDQDYFIEMCKQVAKKNDK